MSTVAAARPLVTSVVPYTDAQGRAVMVAIAKSTWRITATGLVPNPVQMPVQFVDAHLDDDPARPMLMPSDLTDTKPAAEVLVIRPRYALNTAPFAEESISVRVGDLTFSGVAREPWPFGPLSRAHPSRLRFAGTYDETWQQERMPLLPSDFDVRYNLSAPPEQTSASYFAGDEHVTITGLYGTAVSFRLPDRTVLVAGNVRQYYFAVPAKLDTILVWSEAPMLTLVWRHVVRPRQKNAEIGQVTASLIRIRTARELYGDA